MKKKVDLKSMPRDKIDGLMLSLGEPKYRAKQIFSWLNLGVSEFSFMTDLSKTLREKLDGICEITSPELVSRLRSEKDNTEKLLYRLSDGNVIETVLMDYSHGNSVCISTQAGCNMGCVFCASTKGGKLRDLLPSEMADQVIFTQKITGRKISNIVLMGIGEPLDNYDNVMVFLKNINHKDGLNIGFRHISVSTCGLCDKIKMLAQEDMPVTLSVSLHAPNDKLRTKLMPINRKWSVKEVIDACREYFEKTGRRISFEYTLFDNLNDTAECAAELSRLLRGFNCHVNLIAANPVTENTQFKPSSRERVTKFCDMLNKYGINATVRRQLGLDIDASCGQLRRRFMDGGEQLV